MTSVKDDNVRAVRTSPIARPAPCCLFTRLSGAWHRLLAGKAGSAAVVAALVVPIAVGGMGLGAETGYWYLSQRKLQHAADVAAHAAATRLRAGDSLTQIAAAAQHVAAKSGLSASVGTVAVNVPPTSGSKAGSTSSAEVIVTELQPRLISSVFSRTAVTIRGRAVAEVTSGGQACVLALSTTASGAITVSGSTSVALTGCDITSDSNASDAFLMSGTGSNLTTGCVYSVGGATISAGLTLTSCAAVKTQAALVRDPYASVAEPSDIGACQSNKVGKSTGTTTVTPTDTQPNGVKSIRYCNGLDLKGTVVLSAGLYIVENGSLTLNGSTNVSGTGVTIYLRGGADLKLNGNSTFNLAAPTSGPLSGILFFGSRTSAGAAQTISGSSTSTFNGAIYMPGSAITFTGSSGAGGCTQVIGDTVTFTGNSSLGLNCATAGTSTVKTAETVAIVE